MNFNFLSLSDFVFLHINFFILLAAIILDFILGDPYSFPHPVKFKAAQIFHFPFEQPDACFRFCRAERIGTDQFGQQGALMGRGKGMGFHLEKLHANSGFGQLPGRFASGQTGPDDFDAIHFHSVGNICRVARIFSRFI